MADLIAIDIKEPALLTENILKVWDNSNAALIIDNRLPIKTKKSLLESMRPSMYVDDSGETTKLNDPVAVSPGDALVMLTSGTTGNPKGVILTHESIKQSIKLTHSYLNVDPSHDGWLLMLPPYHIGGLMVILRSILTNTRLKYLKEITAQNVKNALAEGYNLTACVPTSLDRLKELPFKAILVGAMAYSGGKLKNLVHTYGMTETCSGVVYNGEPLKNVKIEIDQFTDEISIKSPTLFRAYRNHPDHYLKMTPEGFDPKDSRGFFLTKDIGFFDDENKLKIIGRSDEVIITGGEKVWPQKVENALTKLPNVKEAAIVGLPDQKWGSSVTALIVYDQDRPTYNYQTLKKLLKDELAFYEIPKTVLSVPSLPKTLVGKLQRSKLTTWAMKYLK